LGEHVLPLVLGTKSMPEPPVENQDHPAGTSDVVLGQSDCLVEDGWLRDDGVVYQGRGKWRALGRTQQQPLSPRTLAEEG